MNLKRIAQFAGASAVGALLLAGCGGPGASATQSVGVQGEQLKFDQDALTVPAGQAITVSFKNGSTSQQHNWVLVQAGQEQTVDDAATANGGTVAAGDPGVVAAGNLLDAGGTEQIQFQAPAAGTYTYLCTVPGHYAAGMKGTLTVK